MNVLFETGGLQSMPQEVGMHVRDDPRWILDEEQPHYSDRTHIKHHNTRMQSCSKEANRFQICTATIPTWNSEF